MRHWRLNNPEYKKREAKYFQDNKKTLQLKRTKKHRQRYKQDPIYRIKDILRSRLLKAIKKNLKSGSAVRDLGCSVEQLKLYLESKFQPGMTWDNYGKGCDKWNIDHVKPLAFFDLFDTEQIMLACHYSNLQPIWEKDHYIKTQQEFYVSF